MDKIIYFVLSLILTTPAWAKPSSISHPETSVIVFNMTQNKVEFVRSPDVVRPIASITKIMTAMITLDHDKDLAKTLRLSTRVGSYLPVQNYNRWQLLQAMLVKSDNAAAETLAADYPGGRAAFVARMNSQVREWGLQHTRFEDPTGLSAANVSTVEEVASLMETSAAYWVIREIGNRKQVAVDTQFKKRIRTLSLTNTNAPLLFEFDNILISKTGLTSRAGYCLGLVVEQKNQQYAIVVLGSRSKQDRFRTIEQVMYNHVIDTQLHKQGLTIRP
jgi:D-alanyl-D-alanine endopeptidase (penicillin-binding protein 7)